MPSIQFWFAGVCTFFENFANYVSSPVLPPIRRMVLVDGDDTGAIPYGGILPHVALLTLTEPFQAAGTMPQPFVQQPPPPPGTQVFLLNDAGGAYTISVANADTTQPWTFNAACLPNLVQFVEGGNLGPPSLPVIEGGEAACYVDFQYGNIAGFAVEGSGMGISVVTIVTTEAPVIQIAGAGGTATVTFGDGSDPVQVCISNQPATPGADNPIDFFLNFVTCQTPPPESSLSIPSTVTCPGIPQSDLPQGISTDAGPGCSNTNFP